MAKALAAARTPGRPLDPAVEAAILRAALQLLGEAGYEGLRIEEVARRAGAGKTSIYRRWATRDELILAAVRHFLSETTTRGARSTPAPAASLREDLIAQARRLSAVLTPERAGIVAGLLLAMRTHPELAAMVRQALVAGEGGVMAGVLERAVRRGERRSARVPATMLQVLPGVLLLQVLVLGQATDDRTLTRLVDDVVLPLLADGPDRSRPVRRQRMP
jgi:AcrR family transcriptional regulator